MKRGFTGISRSANSTFATDPGLQTGMLGLTLFCVLSQCPIFSEVYRDPHLAFAHGGRADFRGRHFHIYNFLSVPGFAVNVPSD